MPKGRKAISEFEKEKRIEARKSETKEERFIRIATRRTKKALVALQGLNECVKLPSYSMTREQIITLQNLLNSQVAELMTNFEQRKDTQKKVEFVIDLTT